MSGHGANPISFNKQKKNKDWTSRALATPPTLPTSDNISFLPYHPPSHTHTHTPPQSARHMNITPNVSMYLKLFAILRIQFTCSFFVRFNAPTVH